MLNLSGAWLISWLRNFTISWKSFFLLLPKCCCDSFIPDFHKGWISLILEHAWAWLQNYLFCCIQCSLIIPHYILSEALSSRDVWDVLLSSVFLQ
jgi:hypothetical protein